MNTESDLQCTCDVGPFATCPVCELNREAPFISDKDKRQRDKNRDKREYEQSVTSSFNIYLIDTYNQSRNTDKK